MPMPKRFVNKAFKVMEIEKLYESEQFIVRVWTVTATLQEVQ